jgi:hypothetical protein
MSTRAVVYLHKPDEKKCGKDYTMKLYHHWDWYPGGLWKDLADILKEFKKGKDWDNNYSDRDFFNALVKEWGFEPTCYDHWDTEYIYHITYENNDWPHWINFAYILEMQKGWDENIDKKPKLVLAQEWNWLSKEFNLEEAEEWKW